MSLRVDEQFVYDKLEEWGSMKEIEESVELIKQYRQSSFYPSKDALIAEWEIDHKNIYCLVISVFTAALTNESITYQALCGKLNHKIKLKNEADRVKILADIIGLISTTGLIDINSLQGEKHQISTCFVFEEEIPQEEKHVTVTARPQPVEANWDREHGRGSVFLGHAMNHHEEYARLSHLNRMGQIPFKLNIPFIKEYEEMPKYEPETGEQQNAWEIFKRESLKKYVEVSHTAFYVPHKYCSRGRTYATSYYLNPQGTSYKKAIIQLANTELVEGK